MSTKSRLNRLYREADRICIDRNAKIVLMSDCHRGVGNHGDNFLKNSYLYQAALHFYEQRQFTYMELGDGDELWENRDLQNIIREHNEVFCLLARMYGQGRFMMFFGNHDRCKEKQIFMERNCREFYVEREDCICQLFPDVEVKESLVLKLAEGGEEIFLVHGHQGDLMNDTLWKLSRFLVRHVWRRLELWGVNDPTSTAKNYKRKKKTERLLSEWAADNNVLLIAGHTHRAVLPTPGESMYCNDGSCVHPMGITALEIEGNYITLVKWSLLTRADRSLYVGREVLKGPVKIQEYFNRS